MKKSIIHFFLLSVVALSFQSCGEKNAADQSSDIVYESVDGEEVLPTKTEKKSNRKPLTVVITNLRSAQAPVILGLYRDNDSFLHDEGRLKAYTFVPNGKTLTAQISDQEYGEYAISIYQDENSSGKMDKNILGIPKEGYCLSNNFRPKLKAPSYDDCKFDYDEKSNTLSMKMVW
jgi:uncharacterized protein (DUF2141 family)